MCVFQVGRRNTTFTWRCGVMESSKPLWHNSWWEVTHETTKLLNSIYKVVKNIILNYKIYVTHRSIFMSNIYFEVFKEILIKIKFIKRENKKREKEGNANLVI